MSDGWRKVVAIAAGLIVMATLAVFVLSFEGEEPIRTASSDEEALAVTDALLTREEEPIVVRGWVFVEGEVVRICHGIDRLEGPPACVGPFLTVTGFDPGRLALETAPASTGTIRHTADDVKLLGTVVGDRLAATEVLG